MAEDFLVRTEEEIGTDGLNAVVAQTRATDVARVSILSAFCRGVFAPELAQVYASGLIIAEGFYVSTATGDALRRRLADFGIDWPEAVVAFTTLRFARAPGVAGVIPIPAGTVARCITADGTFRDFATRADAEMAANENEVDVVADADAEGTSYNVGAGTITTLPNPIPDFEDGDVTVTNVYAVTSGRDEGNDEEARQRFYDWLTARTRATPAALEYAAMTYAETGSDGVVRHPIMSAAAEEFLDEPGPDNAAVRLYICQHGGELATDEQFEGVEQRIDGYTDGDGNEVEGWRAAGIKVIYADPVFRDVDVTISLKLSTRGSAATVRRLQSDVTLRTASLPIENGRGRGMLKVKTLFDAICNLGDEVENARIITPVEDVQLAVGQKIVLRSLTILTE